MGFDHIKGQKRAIEVIKKVLAHNRLAQAYLFTGPEGVGKKLTATSLAKALNCHTYTKDFCDQCISCRKIEEGIHPDISLLVPENGEIKIGTIRDIINGMAYRPLEARIRVIILDDAHRLNLSASNAFLKSLEEPPEHTAIILITSSPDTLPDTILSRCQRVYFGLIPLRELTELLGSQGIDRGEAEEIALMAEGSIGRAINMLSSDILSIKKDIKYAMTAEKDTGILKLFTLAEKSARDEETFYRVLDWIRIYIRDMLLIKIYGDCAGVINKDIYNHLLEKGNRMTLWELLDIIERINFLYRGRERNINKQLAIEILSMTLRGVDRTWNTQH